MATPALKELWDVFDAGDADRIRAIFSTTTFGPSTFGPEQAQALLEENIEQIASPNEITRALLDSGASVKTINPSNLREGCGSIDLFRFLAEEGVDFKGKGHEILEDFVHDREIVDFLLDQGVDINRPDETRDTEGRKFPPPCRPPLPPASHGPPLPPASRDPPLFDKTLGVLNNTAALGDIELFDHLVSRGADVSKSIALHTATACPSSTKTRAMIIHLIEDYGFDPNGDHNATGLRNLPTLGSGPWDVGVPLDFAIRHHNLAAVQILLEKGADPNPRHYDVVREFPAAVESFLDAGADANVTLKEAIKSNSVEVAKLCLRSKMNTEIILKDIKDGKLRADPQIIALPEAE